MIYIAPPILAQLKSAVENRLEESCGFLFGHEIGQDRELTDIMSVKNSSPVNREVTYQISSKDYIKAENFADRNGIQLLGVYHSHPNCPATPSEYDRIAAQPFFSYLILSLLNGEMTGIRSWKLTCDKQFEEEFLTIININYPLHGYRNHSNTAA